MTRVLRKAMPILLVVAMVLSGNPGIARAAAASTVGQLYVLDVQVFQADTMDECVRLCEGVGYTPARHNLNEGGIEKVSFGSDVDAPCVMLGYTTTTNRNLALTNLSLLHMGEGYEIRDFQAIAAALLAKNQNYAEGLAAAAADFADHYDKGAPAALQAYKMLDLLYVDDLDKHTFYGYKEENVTGKLDEGVLKALLAKTDEVLVEFDWSDHTPLSEFIVEGNADAAFFGKLLAFGTPTVVNAVNTALCVGSAEYENSYNPTLGTFETKVWAERIATDEAKLMIEGGLTTDEWRSFDAAYLDAARDMAGCLQDFATQYLAAKSRGATVASLASPSVEGTAEEVVGRMDELGEADADGLYMAAHQILNQYHYSDDVLLCDWVVEAGSRAYATDDSYRELYPLVDVLSAGQLLLAKYCGLANLVCSMEQPEGVDATVDPAFEQIVQGLRQLVGPGEEYRVSVWTGVDFNVYRGKVAMTSTALRQQGAHAALALTEEEKAAERARVRQMCLGIAGAVVTIATTAIRVAVQLKTATLVGAAAAAGLKGLGGF